MRDIFFPSARTTVGRGLSRAVSFRKKDQQQPNFPSARTTAGRGLSRAVSFRKKDKQQPKKSKRGLMKSSSFDNTSRDLFFPSTRTTVRRGLSRAVSFRKKDEPQQKTSKRGLMKSSSFDNTMRDLFHPSTRKELPKESKHSELADTSKTVDGDWCDLSHSFLPSDKHESAFHNKADRWSFMSFSEPGEYRTVSQVDFLTDCMAEEAQCIIHFYDENSNHHQAIDSVLEEMASKFPDCKFYRMDSAKGLRISSRFKIKSTPTVLAIRDKKVLDRTSDFGDTSSFQANELRSWVTSFVLTD
jgi:hypothetical protein